MQVWWRAVDSLPVYMCLYLSKGSLKKPPDIYRLLSIGGWQLIKMTRLSYKLTNPFSPGSFSNVWTSWLQVGTPFVRGFFGPVCYPTSQAMSTNVPMNTVNTQACWWADDAFLTNEHGDFWRLSERSSGFTQAKLLRTWLWYFIHAYPHRITLSTAFCEEFEAKYPLVIQA